jgi:hypothetical protein
MGMNDIIIMGSLCEKESPCIGIINEKMNEFYFRFMKLDYIKKKINDFNEKKEKNYFTFWELTKVCGINSNLDFQNKYWELVYVKHGKENITGVLFLFILLSNGSNDDVFIFLKHYLSKYVNKSQDKSKKLIMNLSDFEQILKTYFSCLTIVPFETCDCFHFFNKDRNYDQLSKKFNYENISNYVSFVLTKYVKKNYYVNVEDFLENNLNLLKDDKRIRKEISKFALNKKSKRDSNLGPSSDYDYILERNDENQALTPKTLQDKKFIFTCATEK